MECIYTLCIVVMVITQVSRLDAVTITEVMTNPAEGKGVVDYPAEKALGLAAGYKLVKKIEDKKPTIRQTTMIKYQLIYKEYEVYGYGVTLEVNPNNTWTEFATGLIVKDIESDKARSQPLKSVQEIRRTILERCKFDGNTQVNNFDEKKPKLTWYIDTSNYEKENKTRAVYHIDFLIWKDKKKVQPRNETPKETEVPDKTDGNIPEKTDSTSRSKRAAPTSIDEETDPEISNPQIIIDATNGEILDYTDSLQSYPWEKFGYGGNKLIGRYRYGGDGAFTGHKLRVDRITGTSTCRMKNNLVAVGNGNGGFPSGGCFSPGIYFPHQEPCWTYSNDQYPSSSNAETYSQVHDALHYATRFIEMLDTIYGDTTLLTNCGGEVRLCVHYGSSWDNAFYSDSGHCESYYGDGSSLFYGLASAKVIAHELGHAIIRHTSGLQYNCQSGGMNEAFADISGIVFKAFVDGHDTNWMIGDEIMRKLDWQFALRFANDPPKDKKSIDCNGDYTCQNVHYTSGIYNKGFYNLVMMEHWCMRKAYSIFLRATNIYWSQQTGFDEGLCGLIQAAIDLGYRGDDVREAFAKVGVFCGCPKGWFRRVEYHDHFPHGRRTTCYKMVHDVASWAEARVYCKSMESDLLSIKDITEQQWIYKYITWYNWWSIKHHLVEKSEYWIGAMDMSTEGSWHWIPEDKQVTSTDWRNIIPSSFQDVQNCAALRQFPVTTNPLPIRWKWVDDDCYQKKFFICERSCCGAPCRKNC